MSDRDMGGPAFPTENARQTGPNDYRYEGMTLWDYYAAAALQGFCAKQGNYSVQDGTSFEAAAAQATAMLRERKRRMAKAEGESNE